MKSMMIVAVTVAAVAAGAVLADGTPSPQGARVYFVNLEDGATVTSPVKVIFGLSGMGVAPAGTESEGSGHHHILVDRPPLGEGEAGEEELASSLPSDDNHFHFGGGQTEVMLDLERGTHSLQLVLGDKNHVPHNPPVMSNRIMITVE